MVMQKISLEVKPHEGVSAEKLEEIAVPWLVVQACSAQV